jgi:hypothetical protein
MATAAIAFQDLERSGDQEVISAVVALLKQHSNYNPSSAQLNWSQLMQRSSVIANTGDEALFLFMQAARWADDIRGTPDDCGSCHYINYRYTAGQIPINPRAVPQNPNIETAFAQHAKVLAAANENVSKRAKSLCWTFHLVGDVHQPLHTAALFTPQRPKGDRGGNDFYIRATKTGAVVKLHAYWDGLLIGSERFQSVRNRATEIRAQFPRDELSAFLTRTDFQDWAKRESYFAAVRFSYLNGKLPGALPRKVARIVNGRKNVTPANAPVLPESYASAATFQARQRAALAGYRLADLLRQWFAIEC